jgi:colanic acid biosynthesis glycosyl transferase WcaI
MWFSRLVKRRSDLMENSEALIAEARKIVVVSQHYSPDENTTASIMSAIANDLAKHWPVLVISGTSGLASRLTGSDLPAIVEVPIKRQAKAALIRRGLAETSFAIRVFVSQLLKLKRGDVALTVTAPFMLPYAVAAAARLKGARSILIVHDMFPEALVGAGILSSSSLTAKIIRWVNALMFRALNSVVIIGRDTASLLLRYKGVAPDKIWFIPNWATLPSAVRPIERCNPYRRLHADCFTVGLSGNLGFTHDPNIVFEAARVLRKDSKIHFLLSGWGIGFERLKEMHATCNLANVTLVDRVPKEHLESFLAAADVWLIPYRKNLAGASMPSRFYNILAVGRPVVLVSEADAEAALIVREHEVGWVAEPGCVDRLVEVIRLAEGSKDRAMGERAAAVASHFTLARAMASYVELIKMSFADGPVTQRDPER